MRIGTWLTKRSGDRDGQAALLSRVSIFDTLSKRELRKVEQAMRLRVCPPEVPIFREGDRDEHLYIVVEGRIEIFRDPAKTPLEAPVSLGPGEFFGETALIADAPRTASIIPTETTRLLSLSRSDFRTFCARHPRLGVQIIIHLSQVIAERLRETNRLLKEAQAPRPKTQETEVPEESEILRPKAGGQT
ncbi:MAG: cyclic nucleotide-binding domain-containing protein [Candidatus Latescibacteria bacterium]|nr:cyclic nucleotide-binding domain-containing protein [Candidatus Latescibacterota bacterium]